MTKAVLRLSFSAVAAFALGDSSSAAVIIKTVRCAICVTDTKHPDACKHISADGSVVVSEDALQSLEGETGQGATIMPATTAATPERHRRRHSDVDQ